jgi:hypothetical protein
MTAFGKWFVGSLGRADAYRQAAGARAGHLIGYLTLLVTIVVAVQTVWLHVALVRTLTEFGPWIKDRLPDIHVADGVVSSPAAQPYMWEAERFAFVLDTTGATAALDPKHPQGLLLTKTELFYRESPGRERRYSLAEVKAFALTDETIDRWVAWLKSWLWVVVGAGLWAWLWAAKIVQVALWSPVGLLINAVSGRRLRYGALFKIGLLALTAQLLFDTLAVMGGAAFPGLGLLSLAIYAGYLVRGILVQAPPAPEAGG